ncbi:MAG TPA: deoxynucleoside kinase [Myxococcales bacterium]|nr:deoxynucleoside kinase [Myxococcales bacterium]HIN85266.1 deoxynucleoside kinase [Myxococcales bacterium]
MGSGKSTLVDFLQVRFGVTPYFEPNDENPYLIDFYEDMERWAFQSQVYFLQKKFALHLELEKETGVVVQDRSIYEDAEIFATNLHRMKILNGRDWETYRELYDSIQSRLRPPDLLIFLKCSVRTVRKRIALRARPGEEKVPLSYIKGLSALYDHWYENYKLSESVVIETDQLDYISNLVDRIELLDIISQYLE